ncbi:MULTISPECIES: hypothetical protein [Mesorhizobium]|uniref:hypothetical protein n=1 Tax=Mesorhizobium TaxID=68287 RepID=UPI0003CF1A06|nr:MULTISPECIES: hypothetical protein [Mesorhizobium]ESY70002.1 hypothetical protein X742_05670 [Mesorhizobium sp. LNHC232B00]WJI40285.1 hypothetical protein NL534_08605 [Mesorhizobium opportunistum]
MTDAWNRLISYREGERCRHNGKLFEARFDLCRGLKPIGPHAEKFWRTLPTLPVKATATVRKQPGGYLTRSMSHR